MGRIRKTHEEFVAEVYELVGDEYVFIEKFKRNTVKIAVRHNLCGYEYLATPKEFVRGDQRCAPCSRRERIVEKLGAAPYESFSLGSRYTNDGKCLAVLHSLCGTYTDIDLTDSSYRVRCNSCSRKRRTDAEFKREVRDLVGDDYIFLEEFRGVATKLSVKHNDCGYVYKVRPKSFLYDGDRCPKCANKVPFTTNEFKARVFDLVGEEYSVLGEYTQSTHTLKIRHNDCGAVYYVTPSNFTHCGSRCPNCRYSRGEKAVADTLDSLDIRYSREHIFDQLDRKRFDFYLPEHNIAIEYDGEQHYKAIEAWGGEEKLEQTQESDAIKTDFCADQGIPLLRIPYWEFDNVEQIVKDFVESVKQPQPTA